MKHIVLSFISDDKPGLVQLLSNKVFEADGSWLQSNMSQLAGKFAGIARVSLPAENMAKLQAGLDQLTTQGIKVYVEDCEELHQQDAHLRISLIGQDRPGIVQELGTALAGLQINIEELSTDLSTAAMSAEPLFNADIVLSLPETVSEEVLQEKLDDISERLNLDITLESH